jgi:hypothetical protein
MADANLVIANLNGERIAFCSWVCARRYKAGQGPIIVHAGASIGCWLCGCDLTQGVRDYD